jgi:signal transduction histidine kinase
MNSNSNSSKSNHDDEAELQPTLQYERMRLQALSNQLLEREHIVQERAALMETVDSMVRSISREPNMERLLVSILQSLMTLITQTQKSSMYVFDDLSAMFRFRAAVGYDLEAIASIELTREEAEHRWAGENFRIADGIYLIQEFPENNEGEKFNDFPPPACALAMTIISQGKINGVVFLDNYDDKSAFSADDVEKLIAVREHIGAAFEKVHIIDTLERQTASLHEANTIKTELLDIAAHDLKNPLSAVLLTVELLQQDEAITNDSKAYEMLESITREANRMLQLIHNLLTVSAHEEYGLSINVAHVPLRMLMGALQENYRRPASEKQQQLRFEADERNKNLTCFADEAALYQVLENLLSNAMKFSLPGTTITVRYFLAGNKVRIEVQDEGPGFTEADKQKLFTKFTHLSARPTGGEHSTGLGLSIVKKMVEAMNGRVWCESEAGKGATFVVELPAVAT